MRLRVEGRPLDTITVLVDGSTKDREILGVPYRVNPGEHVFAVRTMEGAEKHATFTLAEGESKSIAIEFVDGTIAPPSSPTKSATTISPVAWAGFGVAATGFAVGIGTALVSINKTDELKANCVDSRCPPSVAGDLDDARRYGTISTAAFAVGAIGATVGLVGLFLGGRTADTQTPTKREASSARMIVGPASVGVAGAF